MIVALLLLIVAILLFGAGVVKGVLANALGFGCGGIVVLMLALKLGSYFGEYGLLWVIAGLVALLGIGVVIEELLKGVEFRQKKRIHRDTTVVDQVWANYVDDIRERFDPDAQHTARYLFSEKDSMMLERFCIEEINRIEDGHYKN